jgi:hypothetical protein
LEKKVAELADALKRCQDEKKTQKMGRGLLKKPLKVKKRISKSFRKPMIMT